MQTLLTINRSLQFFGLIFVIGFVGALGWIAANTAVIVITKQFEIRRLARRIRRDVEAANARAEQHLKSNPEPKPSRPYYIFRAPQAPGAN